jgi:hypothetical protein
MMRVELYPAPWCTVVGAPWPAKMSNKEGKDEDCRVARLLRGLESPIPRQFRDSARQQALSRSARQTDVT